MLRLAAPLAVLLSCSMASASAKIITVNADNSTTERVIGVPETEMQIHCDTTTQTVNGRDETTTACYLRTTRR